MTPTPSHVATDELIETLERLERERLTMTHGFDTGSSFLRHLPALISALKENKRLREALEAINTACDEEIAKRYAHPYMKAEKVAGKSAVFSLLVLPRNIARAALQPQGEK